MNLVSVNILLVWLNILYMYIKPAMIKSLLYIDKYNTSCFISDHFNIYTREAGAGSLSVAIEGPGNAKIKVEERPHGFLGVSYSVDKPGMMLL